MGMDMQSFLSAALVICCAALALRSLAGASGRDRLAAWAARCSAGAAVAAWLRAPGEQSACGSCKGCAASRPALLQDGTAAASPRRVIPLRLVANGQADFQRAGACASHWRASSTQ